jgi:hypothetical protein
MTALPPDEALFAYARMLAATTPPPECAPLRVSKRESARQPERRRHQLLPVAQALFELTYFKPPITDTARNASGTIHAAPPR